MKNFTWRFLRFTSFWLYLAFAGAVFTFTLCTDIPQSGNVEPGALQKVEERPTVDTFVNWFCSTIDQEPTEIRRAVGGTGKIWPSGYVFKIGFIAPATPDLISQTKKFAQDWTKFANVEFTYPPSGPYDIRISFLPSSGAWSYVGTDCKSIPQSRATMNLGWMGKDVVQHEFGHALGLYHEHQNPEGGICWNEAQVIKDLSGPPNNWSTATIRSNVLDKINPSTVFTTSFDRSSVMCYPIPASWTCNRTAIPGGEQISTTDAEFIAIRYPGRTTVSDTLVKISSEEVDRILSILNARRIESDTFNARLSRSEKVVRDILKK